MAYSLAIPARLPGLTMVISTVPPWSDEIIWASPPSWPLPKSRTLILPPLFWSRMSAKRCAPTPCGWSLSWTKATLKVRSLTCCAFDAPGVSSHAVAARAAAAIGFKRSLIDVLPQALGAGGSYSRLGSLDGARPGLRAAPRQPAQRAGRDSPAGRPSLTQGVTFVRMFLSLNTLDDSYSS